MIMTESNLPVLLFLGIIWANIISEAIKNIRVFILLRYVKSKYPDWDRIKMEQPGFGNRWARYYRWFEKVAFLKGDKKLSIRVKKIEKINSVVFYFSLFLLVCVILLQYKIHGNFNPISGYLP